MTLTGLVTINPGWVLVVGGEGGPGGREVDWGGVGVTGQGS